MSRFFPTARPARIARTVGSTARASALALVAASFFAAPAVYGAEPGKEKMHEQKQGHTHPHADPRLHVPKGDESPAQAIAEAHGIEAFRDHGAVSAEFVVDFPGKFDLRGHIVFDTSGGRSKITTDQNVVITFDGETASVSPADAPLPPGMGRFHALTWPYFATAPFKLGDPGATLTDDGPQPWNGRKWPALELTFGNGVGDASDDWFKIFADGDHHLHGMAYIVSYGKTAAEAAKSPSAIVYRDYVDVDGALLSTAWTFHGWDAKEGLSKKPVGHGVLAHVTFVDVDENTFAHPTDRRIDAKP